MFHHALAATASLVALAFALSTYERWLARRRPHELAWSIALAMFSLAAILLGLGNAVGWSSATFRLYFFFGAIANVPFLALGTLYLLGGKRVGDRAAAVIALFVAFSAGVLAVEPFTRPLAPHVLVPRAAEVFGPLPRVLAAVASGGGALVVFGGAAWSAVRYRRGRMVAANVLIALGTAILSASGLLNGLADAMTAFMVTLAVGITVIFAGFLVASSGPAPPATAAMPVEAAGEAPSRPRLAAVRQQN
ncbi:MAG TPA: hypothetical protein VFA94_08105 [Acidimicrobiales bacterium]|nr:hypothetical protein [Acidimicrobiales bacterium]